MESDTKVIIFDPGFGFTVVDYSVVPVGSSFIHKSKGIPTVFQKKEKGCVELYSNVDYSRSFDLIKNFKINIEKK